MSEKSSRIIAAWQNASQRSRVCAGMNRSVRGWSEKCFEWSNSVDTALYINIPLPFSFLLFRVFDNYLYACIRIAMSQNHYFVSLCIACRTSGHNISQTTVSLWSSLISSPVFVVSDLSCFILPWQLAIISWPAITHIFFILINVHTNKLNIRCRTVNRTNVGRKNLINMQYWIKSQINYI